MSLREKIRRSDEFKERLKFLESISFPADEEEALTNELSYYNTEGAYLRKMKHIDTLQSCQYVDGRCVICGGFEPD